ncbi:uncharacterized protein LOC131953468 [Physella acuta]|uniref:uncharacterized protein LOC131953468 n=1 Tax=Physella acuta TaxID=109671 RepID=UPI0027DE6518|nr:uncharacterized protein LOC131953468 [Physella acuta]
MSVCGIVLALALCVLCELYTGVVCQSCNISLTGLRTRRYRAFNGLDISGCNTTSQLASSFLTCSNICSLANNCVAFTYNTQVCSTCAGGNLTNLTFTPGKQMHVSYQYRQLDVPLNPVTNKTFLKVPVDCDITEGSTVYISGTYLSYRTFIFEFTSNANANTNIHFKPHYDPNLAYSYILMNSRVGQTWGAVKKAYPSPFSFQVNKTAEVYILVRKDRFVFYVNGVYVCDFAHAYPYTQIDTLNVYNGFKIDEISFS